MIGKLFGTADRYMQESDWKTMAVLKFCLVPFGMILGLSVKEEYRKPAMIAAGSVFFAAYIPLMAKFFRLLAEEEKA